MSAKVSGGVYRWGLVLLSGIALIILSGCESSSERAENQQPEVKVYDGLIVAMGDSLTAGLGVRAEDSYPALLQKMLTDSGINYQVINAGVSGETSSGAKSRVDWVLKMKPDIVILETGANDGLRGIPPKLIEENVKHIIESLLGHNVGVVLVGMQMVANLGPDYLDSFNRLYPDLAANYPIVFMPFFLKDVAAESSLNQPDGLHPTVEGYQIIAVNLFPYVKRAIKTTKF